MDSKNFQIQCMICEKNDDSCTCHNNIITEKYNTLCIICQNKCIQNSEYCIFCLQCNECGTLKNNPNDDCFTCTELKSRQDNINLIKNAEKEQELLEQYRELELRLKEQEKQEKEKKIKIWSNFDQCKFVYREKYILILGGMEYELVGQEEKRNNLIYFCMEKQYIWNHEIFSFLNNFVQNQIYTFTLICKRLKIPRLIRYNIINSLIYD